MKRILLLLLTFSIYLSAFGQPTDAAIDNLINTWRTNTNGQNTATFTASVIQAINDGKTSLTGTATGTGSSNTYAVTVESTIVNFTKGFCIRVKFPATNSGASTIDVNGLGAKDIKKVASTVLASGDITNGQIYDLCYDVVAGYFKIVGSAGSGGGGGGSSTFTGLTDAPSSYTGQSLKSVRVNAGETALEFTTASSGSSTSFLGFKINATTFASTTGFTNNGSTVSAGSGHLNFSGGAGTFTQTLDLNGASCLENYRQKATFITGAKNGTSYGFGLGVRSLNTFSDYSMYCFFNATNVATPTGSGSLSIVLKRGATETYIDISKTVLSFSSGDSVRLTFERRGNKIFALAENATTPANVPAYAEYEFTSYTGTVEAPPNTGRFCISSFGGSFSLSAYSVYSTEIVGSELLVKGDSKTLGYFVTLFDNRYSTLLKNNIPTVITSAGSGDRIVELALQRAEILALAPKKILLAIGSNDKRSGGVDATYIAAYDAEVTAYEAAGISVYHCLSFAETVLDQSALDNHIIATYAPGRIVSPRITSDDLDSDGVHLNDKGHKKVFGNILNRGFLTAPTNQDLSKPYYQYWTPTITGVSGISVSARYIIVGKQLHFRIHTTTPGTSTATTLTFTLPSNVYSSYTADQYGEISTYTDNGTSPTTPGYWTVSTNSNIITCYKNNGGTAWTSSGTKAVYFSGIIEIN